MHSADVKLTAHNFRCSAAWLSLAQGRLGQLHLRRHCSRVASLCLQGVAAKLCTTMPLDGASAGEPVAEPPLIQRLAPPQTLVLPASSIAPSKRCLHLSDQMLKQPALLLLSYMCSCSTCMLQQDLRTTCSVHPAKSACFLHTICPGTAPGVPGCSPWCPHCVQNACGTA